MAQSLGDNFDADAVVLFGSYARHDATEDSDIDLLVVMPHEVQQAEPIYLAMRKSLATNWPYPLDLVIRSRQAVEKWQSIPYSLIHEALRDGKVLYARQPR